MKDSHIINFNEIKDTRGKLVSIENCKNIPFEIKRVYYLYALNISLSRGYHAHRKLKQILICINGNCEILLDDGYIKKTYRLETRNKGILIEHMVWREMYNFSKDCVILVLASDYYNEDDYIRNYEQFIDYLKRDNH